MAGPKRKVAKKYTMVNFEVDGFEGEFVLPKLDSLPLGVASAVNDGDIFRLLQFIEETAPDMVDAVESLSGEEFEGFISAWSDGSGVKLPK